MNFTDWVGFIGVAILLLAYLLNLAHKIPNNGIWYIGLNLAGAGIALVASILLHYMPFIILEAAWTLVTAYSLVKLLRS